MKKNFIAPLLKEGLPIISKMCSDANLNYLYNGPKELAKAVLNNMMARWLAVLLVSGVSDYFIRMEKLAATAGWCRQWH